MIRKLFSQKHPWLQPVADVAVKNALGVTREGSSPLLQWQRCHQHSEELMMIKQLIDLTETHNGKHVPLLCSLWSTLAWSVQWDVRKIQSRERLLGHGQGNGPICAFQNRKDMRARKLENLIPVSPGLLRGLICINHLQIADTSAVVLLFDAQSWVISEELMSLC